LGEGDVKKTSLSGDVVSTKAVRFGAFNARVFGGACGYWEVSGEGATLRVSPLDIDAGDPSQHDSKSYHTAPRIGVCMKS
jgi:hypothetical protein